MRQQDDERELIRSYLLGRLEGERLGQVELRLLSDSQFQEDVRAAEDELIDDYVFGLLSDRERESFERHFLSTPERAEKLRFARAVKDYLGQDAKREESPAIGRESWWRTLLRPPARRKLLVGGAFALCLLVTLVVAFFLRELRHRRMAQEQMARVKIEQEVDLWTRNPPVSGDQYSRFAKLSLTPGVLRESSHTRRLVITDETLAAQLRLQLEDPRFDTYEATLLTDEDVLVFTVGSLRPLEDEGEMVLILRIPAKTLPDGDYQLKLRGISADGQMKDAGNYPFQVIRKSA